MKSKLSRLMSLMLAVFMVFGMVIADTGSAWAASDWEILCSSIQYAGDPMNYSVEVMNFNTGKSGKVISAKSSKSTVVKITKGKVDGKTYYWMNFKKVGKAKITVEYKRPNGKKYKAYKTITVKKYPNPVKSLKVNGKAVTISKNKYTYSVNKYKKTTAKIKMATKNGWKINGVYVSASNWNTGKSKKIKVKVSDIKNGNSFSFPKGYDGLDINISLVKGDDYLGYYIFMGRN